MSIGIAGLVFLVIGLCCMYWWKCWNFLAAWLMLLGGLCLTAAGAPLLTRAATMVMGGIDSATSIIGAAGAGALIAALVSGIHAGRSMWHLRKGPTPSTSHQWAAFVFPVFVIAAGGLTALFANLQSGTETGINQLSSFLGS